MGTAPVENRNQPKRYKRKSAPAEAAPKIPSPTTATAGTGTTAASRTGTDASPIKASDSSKQEIPEPAFEVEAGQALSPNTPKWAKWKSGKKAKEQAAQTALTLLTILDGAISMTLGPECAMTADEHAMIDEPLARILARMTPETTELIDKWTDPLLLATGLIMWAARVFLVLQREAKQQARKPRKAEPIQPAPSEPQVGLDLNHPIQATGIPVEVAEALG